MWDRVMAAEESIQLVESPEEALSPREVRLEQGAAVLKWGAIANAALSVVAIVLAFLGGVRLLPNVFPTLHNLLLGRMSGGDDAALAAVVLLLQINIGFLLVVMVGALAREVWSLFALWLGVIINGVALVLLGFTPALVTMGFAVLAGIILSRDLRAFRTNPVMLKEIRGRMRGIRAFVVLTVYLGLMSGFTALLYLVYLPVNQQTGSAAAGEVGRVLFMGIVGIELMLIIFIAPAFTAGAITGERERQTYDLLRTTLLPSPSFVIGKLESALSYVLLLLLAAIPLQSIAFLFGGVSELELILSFEILMVTAVALGTVGIFFSAIAPRTLSASVRAYTATLVATFGAPLVATILLDILTGALRTTSPFVEAVLIYIDDFLISLNPIATALQTQQLLIDRQVLGFWTDTLASNGSTIPRVSPWITFTIIYLVVAAILVVLSIQRMRKVEQ
jgi:ABC-2 type transport system permease protein